jgi:hypothetical protein
MHCLEYRYFLYHGDLNRVVIIIIIIAITIIITIIQGIVGGIILLSAVAALSLETTKLLLLSQISLFHKTGEAKSYPDMAGYYHYYN